MKKIILFAVLIFSAAVFSQQPVGKPDDKAEIEAIKKTIVDGYVDGIFLKGDAELIKKSWHNECDIVVMDNDQLFKNQAKNWVERMKRNPKPLDPKVTYSFTDVKVTGTAGIAIVEIYTGGKHLYTDFMSMYKFSDGWKICTKIFYTHPRS